MSRFRFHNPVEVRFGPGCREDLHLLVEPPVLMICGLRAAERCGGELLSLASSVVRVGALPSSADVDRGLAQAEAIGARTVVGLGGGSALDAARSVAVAAGYALRLADLGPDLPRRVRLVQVPTTAGTGSEVTRWASLWDEGRKWSLDRPSGYADAALVDPELTASMPPRLTLAVGLDALSHAVEALWGRHADPVSDLYAEEALRLATRFLPSVLDAPGAEARDGMCRASLLGGLALSHTRSAAAHALSYNFTGRRGLEHGLATGLLSGALLPWTAERAPQPAGRILAALGLPGPRDLLAWIRDRFDQVGVPSSLSAHGISPEDVAEAIRDSLSSNRMANHPGAPSETDLQEALSQIA